MRILFVFIAMGTAIGLQFNVSEVEKRSVSYRPIPLNKLAERIQQYYYSIPRNVTKRLTYETGMVNHRNLVDLSQGIVLHENGTIITEKAEPLQNAFLGAILTAYRNHLPLQLSPDDWWLMIMISLSQHIHSESSSAYKLFNQSQLNNLTVLAQYPILFGAVENNLKFWPNVIRDISDKISENTIGNLAELFTKRFSTTNVVEQTAFRVVQMNNLESHGISHRLRIRCGIPEMTLDGAVQDYNDIIQRINQLSKSFPKFSWYLDRVKLHTQILKQTMMGNKDIDWWRGMVQIYRPKANLCGIGDTIVTGWIADWFAYRRTGSGSLEPLLGRRVKLQREGGQVEESSGSTAADNVRGGNHRLQIALLLGKTTKTPTTTSTMSSPVKASVHVHIDDINTLAATMTTVNVLDTVSGRERSMLFTGGFMGVAQNRTTKAIRPSIGWITFYQY